MTSQFDNTVQADALDAEGLYQQLLTAIRPLTATADKPVRLVGIASGGVWLAQRLQKDLGLAGESGVISSSLHRIVSHTLCAGIPLYFSVISYRRS